MATDTNPIQHMADALAAHDRACRLLFDRLDYAFDLLRPAALPTKVLTALDYCRATAAELFPYVSGPFIKEPEPQAADGPTQDQAVTPFVQIGIDAIEGYRAGLLSIEECEIQLHRMISEEAYALRAKKEQQATREAADNGEQPPFPAGHVCAMPYCDGSMRWNGADLFICQKCGHSVIRAEYETVTGYYAENEPPETPTVPGTPIPVMADIFIPTTTGPGPQMSFYCRPEDIQS